MKKGDKMTLSCGGKYWCPVVEFDGKNICISDDDGNRVQIPSRNWDVLVKKAKAGELDIS